MSEKRPTWTYPFGVKLTDWVAVVAFVLSVVGLLWTAFARQLSPSTDVAYPEEIQFQCLVFSNDSKVPCTAASPLLLVADLFSIWNDSVISTKPQILRRIDATIVSGANGNVPWRWKYFTEIVHSKATQKANSGRAIFYYGELRNIEVLFSQSQLEIDLPYTWELLSNDIANNDIDVEFVLDFAYGPRLFVRCALTFASEDVDQLKAGTYDAHFVLADAVCNDTANN